MSEDGLQNATVPLSFKKAMDLLSRDQAKDLVRSLNKFMKEFQRRPPDASIDSQAMQDFFIQMEVAVHKHPLFQGAQPADIEEFMEAVERYLLIKLYERTFGRSNEDVERDDLLSRRMAALRFVQPEHLEITQKLVTETFNQSLQLAEKALINMNLYKAPRDKLVCILNCCRVINNLLSQTGDIAGADDFTPILIYTVIRAQPEHLASNLAFIERYRMQSRLVSEAQYYFIQLSSAAAFIETLNANSLKVERDEFIAHMLQHGALTDEELLLGSSTPTIRRSSSIPQPAGAAPKPKTEDVMSTPEPIKHAQAVTDSLIPFPIPSMSPSIPGMPETAPPLPPPPKTLAELETDGVKLLLDEEATGNLHKKYKFLYTTLDDLMVGDVQVLLSDYKELALKYEMLRLAVENQTAEVAKHLQAGSQPISTAAVGSTTPQPVSQLLDAWSAADDNAPVLMTNLPPAPLAKLTSGIMLAPATIAAAKTPAPNGTGNAATLLAINSTTSLAPLNSSSRPTQGNLGQLETSSPGVEGAEGGQDREVKLSPAVPIVPAVEGDLIDMNTQGDAPSTPKGPASVSPVVTPTIGLRRPDPVAATEDAPAGSRVNTGLAAPVTDLLA